ncbi:LytR family transcriptional regulator [Aeromicrobium sp. Root495]|uniref:LytR/AlgR family response regulator transcription factor n=1 Tax=Aeromicrobium sp. Root495 TaxID=1736550 RepID=UPI0006FCF07E|nr:LytTR family DNA-binding domain-containing protein [Aeromicrobium sp. Root495]KQY60528.1 LytR family transcriptional regulator [Aeromicrobium sp. Root495]
MTSTTGLRTLVVDDEQPARDELVFLLGRDDRIGAVDTARSGAEALRRLEAGDVDLMFLDVAMPGLSGIDIARVVAQFRHRPHIVFVTAHDNHAVDAFELGAVDYLLKPIREERLAESIRRAGQDVDPSEPADETITVELAGVTRFVQRSRVTYAEANGDYVRLHTADGAHHLIRTALSGLADDWAPAGFARVHRSIVVNLAHVRELRQAAGRTSVVVPSGDRLVELAVARRHTRAVRELLTDRGA